MYPSSSAANNGELRVQVEERRRQMVSRASWEKLQYTITDGRNANTVRVLLGSRYPLLLSDLDAEQEAALRAATQTSTDAVVELFMGACTQGNLAWVEYLLPICGANCENRFHQGPLEAAADGGHVEVIEYLYENGAVINFQTLFAAMDKGNAEALEFLLSRIDTLINLDNILQRTLYEAVFNDHTTMASLLIAHGADVTTPLIRNMTVLSEAKSPEMIAVLLREGAGVRSGEYGANVW